MGCDYFADDSGVLRIEFTTTHGRYLTEVDITDLKPGQEVFADLVAGRDR